MLNKSLALNSPNRRLTPASFGSLAAWYDLGDLGTMVVDGSNRISLIGDKSGNGLTALCMNGSANQGASSPDSAATSITGDIDLRVWMAPDTWTPAANQVVLSKYNTSSGSHRSYWLRHRTTGVFDVTWSSDGSSAITATSTASVSASAYSRLWVRATLDVNNGSGGWTVKFYTSSDGSTWSQLGADVTGVGVTSIFDGPATINIGGNDALAFGNFTGKIYRAQIYNGIGGTLVFDANFTAASKLATSFTESSANAATVTVASSGSLGARISGERDLVQFTASQQPVYTAATRIATFDGTDDYVRSAPFSLSQPVTVYIVGKQITWAAGDYVFDGGTQNTMALLANPTTPSVRLFAGANAADNSGWALGTSAVISAVFNGASSSIRVNRGTATTGSAGSASGNGFTVGSSGVSGGAGFENVAISEIAIFNAAHSTATRDEIAVMLGARNNISV